MLSRLPYPTTFDIDTETEIAETRATQARERIDPSDLLAVVQHIMLEIADDQQHPLWPLIRHCAEVGTMTETGKRPHQCEGVGEAFLPLIDNAISRLVDEKLADVSAWED
jgi:hypothetical protein